MKVLHMISGGDTGGAKTHVFALMHKLSKLCDVKIVCFLKGSFFDELQDIDVKSVLIEQKNRFDLSVVSELCDICKKDGIQVIHAHGARANFIAARLKKKVDIPIVTTVHSDYKLDFDGLYKKLVFTTLNTRALKKLDYYIGVSSSFKDMLISRGFRPNSIFTVYNGMDYSTPTPFCSKEEFAKRIGLEYDPNLTYVGLIGRHDFVKGHDVFLNAASEALKTNKKLHFVIAGDGNGRQQLIEQAKSLGITENLTFAGFINDIYSFLNFIDINTLTSRCESFPYVLMEGARMKKPTISSRVGGIPDLIRNGQTGLLFESENYAELAKHICTLAQDKQIASLYGENLYALATTTFSSTSLAKTHVDIYSAILRDYKDKKTYDVIVSGYYGYKNSGDDALLLGMINSLKEQKPDIRIAVLSKNPCITKNDYALDSFSRFNIFQVRKGIKSSHMLINGGGSLIQDATSFKSLMYYLYVMRLAKKKGLKVFVYANGIGPLKDKSLPYAKKVLQTVDMITLRDGHSQNVLKKMGLEEGSWKLSADPALLLSPQDKKLSLEILERENIPTDIKILSISVRPYDKNDPDFENKLAQISDTAYEKYGLTSVFVPLKPASDLKLCESISSLTKHKSYVITRPLGVTESIGLVSLSQVCIGMRLHMLIYCVCAGVPGIGITYDPKIDGFTEYIHQDYKISASNLDTQKLLGYLQHITENYDEITGLMEERLKELQALAKESAKMAVEML